MPDICTDNRFELIDKYKTKLLDSTNIETSPEEMAVIDNILFRFWQMGWLDKLEHAEAEPVKRGKWIKVEDDYNNCLYECSYCHTWTSLPTEEDSDGHIRYCWSCGAKMDR